MEPNDDAMATGAVLTLVGTGGGPSPMPGRRGICTALTIDGATYVVDVGHGGFTGLHECGVDVSRLAAIFVTHLHSDHVSELYQVPFLRHGGLRRITGELPVIGPGRAGELPRARSGAEVPLICPENPTPGIVDLIEHSIAATAYDLNIRVRDEGWRDIRTVVKPRDIVVPKLDEVASGANTPPMEPFAVYEDANVRVSAILVPHPPVFPAFAFRLDTASGSIVVSGDTAPSENVVRLATGADVLVHEVIALDWARTQGLSRSIVEHLEASHTDVDRVGSIAERAGVRTLVLTHLVPGDVGAVSDEDWRRRAQTGFSGRVIVGRDLMRLDLLGDGDVELMSGER